MSAPIHHLHLSISGCLVEVRLNGFRLLRRDALRGYVTSPPINPYLVGRGNRLVVEALPPDPAADPPVEVAHVTLEGAVRAYRRGEQVAPGAIAGELVRTLEVPPVLAERALDERVPLPVGMTFGFDSAGPSFANRLLGAEPFDDEAGLRAYALHLLDLLAGGSADALAAEFEPKLMDYATAHDRPWPPVGVGFAGYVRDRLLPARPRVDLTGTDLVLEPHCDGRLWEVRRASGEPLIITDLDADGGRFELPVHVGRVGGSLRVVR